MEVVVTAIGNFINDLLSHAPTVIGGALGLFGAIFGLRFVIRLVKSASK
jgi:formiminotetrahydrofolate cyclodeaminase